MTQSWLQTGLEDWMIRDEALKVIALRTVKFSAGGTAAGSETIDMIGEKIASRFALQEWFMTQRLE